MPLLHLYTFKLSHFSEKARWALDWSGLPYEEARLVPGAHLLKIRLGLRARATTVPVLVEDNRAVIQGSSAILDHLARRLGRAVLEAPPAVQERASEIERLANRAFGRGTQRIFYDELLADRSAVIELWSQDGPAWARAFLSLSYPLLARGARRAYGIPAKVGEAKERFRRAMEEMDRILASRPYLVADRPTRADVTVASLLAPLCRPPEHVLRWPTTMPHGLEAFVSEFRDRPTWRFVLRMYKEHRSSSEAL
jgi:glutathione S-transferase